MIGRQYTGRVPGLLVGRKVNHLPATRPARKHLAVVLKRREYAHASPKRRSHLRHTGGKSMTRL